MLYFSIYRSLNNKWLGDFPESRINEPYIIGLYNVDSGVPYDKAAVVMLDVQDGEDLASAVERHGVAFAKALEESTKPYKNGNVVGLTTSCSYAYTENEDQPQYLNEVVGDQNAARVVADIYQDHIRDGFFWEAADDIIAKYFNESIDRKIAEKMVRHAARIFMDWSSMMVLVYPCLVVMREE